MLRGLRERLLGHGGYDHAHSHAAATDQGIRAVQVSLVALAITAALQAAVVVLTGSVALLADTLHNLTDALTGVPLWIAYVVGRRAPDRRYTYGYGRAEDLAGIAIVLAMAASIGFVVWESIDRLLRPAAMSAPLLVLAAGAVGVAGNELVARYRIRVGGAIGSAALVADGHHARSDALTSAGVAVAAVAAIGGVPAADPIVGLAIAVMMLAPLRSAATQVYRRLMDAVDPALVDEAERILGRTPGVETAGPVRIRWSGHELWAEAHVVIDCDRPLGEAHEVTARAEHDLLHAIPHLSRVTVHADPCSHDGRDHHELLAHHDRSPTLAGTGTER